MKRIIAFMFIVLLLIGCSSSDDSSSNSGEWELTNLDSNISFYRICTAGNTLYITNGTNIYRSIDNGDNWTTVSTGLTNILSYDIFVLNGEIHISATKNINPQTVRTNYYKSSNNGDTWIEVLNSLSENNLGCGFPERVFAVGSKLYGQDRGISKICSSSDNGISWEVIPGNFYSDVFEVNFLFDGSNYFITDMTGIYKSTDGINFNQITGLTTGAGFKYSTSLGNRIFISAGQIIKVTNNGGQTFSELNDGLIDGFSILTFLYSNGQKVYAGVGDAIFVLDNNTWSEIGEDSDLVQVSRNVASNNNYIFVQAEGGLYRHSL